MKKLYVVRHAKSSWSDLSKGDHGRSLNERGRRDAPLMAKLLYEKYNTPEFWISSSAVRALETADYFLHSFGISENQLFVRKTMYHASDSDLISEIHKIDERFQSAIIFGHNPGLSDLVDVLCGVSPGDMPTCAIAVIRAEAEYWANIEDSNNTLIELLFPKKKLS